MNGAKPRRGRLALLRSLTPLWFFAVLRALAPTHPHQAPLHAQRTDQVFPHSIAAFGSSWQIERTRSVSVRPTRSTPKRSQQQRINEADPMALIAAVNHNLTRSASPLGVAFVPIGGIRWRRADIHRISRSGQGGHGSLRTRSIGYSKATEKFVPLAEETPLFPPASSLPPQEEGLRGRGRHALGLQVNVHAAAQGQGPATVSGSGSGRPARTPAPHTPVPRTPAPRRSATAKARRSLCGLTD